MKNQIERFSTWLSKLPEQLKNKYQELFLAYLSEKLLLKRTTSFPHRTTLIFANISELENQLTSILTQKDCSGVLVTQQRQQKNPLNICFVFSGQGPQWWKMGRELYFTEPVFHSWINKISEEFSLLTKDWTLVDELMNTKDESSSRINDTNIAQPGKKTC
jgi:acyl transferase domain-containing protein